MKFKLFFILFCVLVSVSSCHKDNPVELSGEPDIISLKSDSVAVGDTVIIKGEFFGMPASDKTLTFDSSITVNSTDCLRWNNYEIRVIVPKNSKSGLLKYYEKNILKDSIKIIINPVPFFDVIEVAAGKFLRGSETSSLNEMPVREITISKPFLISKYEISQRIYEAVIGENPSGIVSPELPVDKISWNSAVQFCNNLSVLHNLEPVYTITGNAAVYNAGKNGWRLPTEAEWEYACRAGSNSDFSGTGVLTEMGWFGSNSGLKMHPSGNKLPNAWGIYDMHGNVWEWCWDYFDDNFYQVNEPADPKGPSTGTRRVLRGGSWNDGINFERSSNRTIPEKMPENNGIRIVRNK